MMWVAGICAGGAAAGLGWYGCAARSSQWLGPALVRGSGGGRSIALSFDDGPAPPFTEQILDLLRARGITATFFVCGKNVERHPDVLRRIRAEGHSVGNHTYSHPFLCLRARRRIGEEIDRTQEAVRKITGEPPSLFRPPYGVRWFGLRQVLRERGLRMVMWSDSGLDWKQGAEAIASTALKNLRPGAILLLHDGHGVLPPEAVDRSATVRALPRIIDSALGAGGFSFVSVKDFLPP
jgi:peptidoglycan-N-acetylglucosamine deacetylase